MNRNKDIYASSNTFFWIILRSPRLTWHSLKNIYKLYKYPKREKCDIKFTPQVAKIDHEYKKIEDESERNKARTISIESDLRMLRYFSEIRQAAYILIALGFILQFFTFILSNNT